MRHTKDVQCSESPYLQLRYMIRTIINSIKPIHTLRFATFKKTQRTVQPQAFDPNDEQSMRKHLVKFIQEDRQQNHKIRTEPKGHLCFYAYLGVLSTPLFVSGLSLIGLTLVNPTSALLPWMHYAFSNIGAMTMLGFTGLDMASLAVWNILNPDTIDQQSNKLRIILYGAQILGIIGSLASGHFTGPEFNVILVQALMLNMAADISCKQANVPWYQSKKNVVLCLCGLLFVGAYIVTSKHKESMKLKEPRNIQEMTLKLNDYR